MRRFVFALLVLIPSIAQAQVANPVSVKFTPSPDHNATSGTIEPVPVLTGYRMKVFPQAQCPVVNSIQQPCTGTAAFTLEFNKPAVVAGEITMSNIFGGLVMNTSYKGIVEAYGPGGATASSVVGPFGNQPAPAAPGAPVNPALLRAQP